MPITIPQQFLPQAPGTGFVMNSAGQLVPIPRGGLPAVIPPAVAPPPFTAPEGTIPRANFGRAGVMSSEAKLAEALKNAKASMASPAAALGETGAVAAGGAGAGGIISRVAGISPLLTAATAGLTPFLADPGSDSMSDYSGGIELPNLPDEGDDLGITQIGKSYARGAKRIVKGAYDIGAKGANAIGDLFKTKDERAIEELQRKADEARLNPPPAPTSPTAALNYSSPNTGLPDYVIPGTDATPTPAENQLLALLGELRPKDNKLTDEQKKSFKINQALAGLNSPANSLGEVVRNAVYGYNGADDKITAYEQAQHKELSKETADWAKNYAETAVNVEKNRLTDAKDNVKIHQGKGGAFLVQATDAKGNTTLHPITGIGNNDAHITIGGQKYAANTPLTKELTLMKSLGDVGKLAEIMKDNEKIFADNKIGVSGDSKKDEQEKVLALAGAMRQHPEVYQKYVEKYVKDFGQSPVASPAMGLDATDYLTELTQGQ